MIMEETMNAVNETAISQEPETQQETPEVQEPDTQPQVQENDEGESAQSGDDSVAAAEQAEEQFLPIKYFGETINLSKAEAKNYAEIGKRYSDVRDTLERLATLKGQTVEEFLNGIETAQDEAYRQELISKFGEDNEVIDSLMELYQSKKQQTLDGAKAKKQQETEEAKQNENKRLADEFIAMKKDFPELSDFASLPTAVKQAASGGMSLSHAYLLYMHKENQKIAAAKQNAEEAAKKSTGSMHSDKEAGNTTIDAMLKGVWS